MYDVVLRWARFHHQHLDRAPHLTWSDHLLSSYQAPPTFRAHLTNIELCN
jgi:hypothetical protein